MTLYLAWQRKRFIAFFLSTMKTSNGLTAYIQFDGFKDDIAGNNILLVQICQEWFSLVLYVFNKLCNRNANELKLLK